ncbi:hypothetical protein ACWKT6_35125, partial [Mesorhizobium sp. 14Arga]
NGPGCGRWTRTQAAIAWPQRCRIAGTCCLASFSGHVTCIVNTSNRSTAREPPCVFVAAQGF